MISKAASASGTVDPLRDFRRASSAFRSISYQSSCSPIPVSRESPPALQKALRSFICLHPNQWPRMSIEQKPLVGIIMGSQSDWETMQHAAAQLDELNVPYEVEVISAHRTPDLLFEYATSAVERGLQVIIA